MDCHQRNPKQCKVVLLNLTARYAPAWSHWEGIREFIQNWHDGIFDASDKEVEKCPLLNPNSQIVKFNLIRDDTEEVVYEAIVEIPGRDDKCYGSLHYDKSCKRLTLINRGISLQKKILLLGYSSHTRNPQVIGQFGEGLKIGALALVRQSRYVTMETNKERWKFDLLPYEQYGGEQGLVVLVTQSDLMCTDQYEHLDLIFPPCPVALQEDDTSSSISSIFEDEFNECRKRFLFLTPPKESVETEIGTLLLDSQFSGNLFVKGSFVVDLRENDLVTGVDFSDLKIDRDRNAVPQLSEIDHKISCMWPRALEIRNDLAHRYYDLLEQHPNCRDVRHAINYAGNGDPCVPKLIAEEFAKKSPDNAFPVSSSHPKHDLPNLKQELGLEIVVVNDTLLTLLHLSGRYKTLQQQRETLRPDKSNLRPRKVLTKAEEKVIKQAIRTVNDIDPELTYEMIVVIDTKSEEKPAIREDKIEIPIWMLKADVVHKNGELCKLSQNKCWCRQIRLCNALVHLRKDQIGAQPGRHAKEPPPDQTLMALQSHFVGRENEKAPPFCIDVHQLGNVLDSDAAHAKCVQDEEHLRKEIKRIKIEQMQSQKEHQDELAKLNQDCMVVRKDLMSNMVRDANVDQQMAEVGEQYRQQLEGFKQGKMSELTERDANIKELDDELLELQKDLNHKQRLLQEQQYHVDRHSKSLDHRHTAMMEKVRHFRMTLEEKAKKVKTLDTSKKKDGNYAHTLCQQLITTCYDIRSELEGQSYMCIKCKSRKRSHVVFPCCHYKFCEVCATHFEGKRCPVQNCRKIVEEAKKMYE